MKLMCKLRSILESFVEKKIQGRQIGSMGVGVCYFKGKWKVAFEQICQRGCGCLLLWYLRPREQQVQRAGACHVNLKNGKAAILPGIGLGSERMVAKEV